MLESDATKLHEGRRRMYDVTDAYRRSFVDPATGLIASKYTEHRACPVCAADEPRAMFVKNGGSYVKCGACAMVYLNPVFKDADLRAYYENNNTEQANAAVNESDFYRRIYQTGLDAIAETCKPGPILDLGCSSGFFLDRAREAGWETYGIELNRAEFAMTEQRGHKVCNTPLEETSFDVRFKAITMWDVFEHIKRGREHLERLRGLLAPGGVVFLQIPSAASLAARVLQERCNMFDGIEHVNLYAPSTIGALCEKAGFRVATMKSVIGEIQVLKKYLDYEDPYFSDRAGATDLPFLSEEAIHGALLGYKLQVVATVR